MSASKDSPELGYSSIEIGSYLPPGWVLEEGEGHYETDRGRWQVEVQDVSELVSTLAVSDKDALRLGRIPALRAAIERLVRKA